MNWGKCEDKIRKVIIKWLKEHEDIDMDIGGYLWISRSYNGFYL